MTLFRQLVIVIVAIFIAVFIGTFAISVHNNRDYLNSQLQSHAQDTATMLGLSLSPHFNDQATMESMIKAVFDRGDYRLIRIDDLEQKPIAQYEIAVVIDGVPHWFINFIDLDAPLAESLLMKGWNQAGKVFVASHPGYAYQQAWRNFVDTLFWFSICAIGIVALALWLLQRLLKPLKAVEMQAKSIIRKDFVIQDEIPNTRELRRVVLVMNQLSQKVKKMFLEQSEKAESLREQLFTNNLTELPNRRYFDAQLQHLIDTPEEFETGTLFLIALSRLQEINQQYGYYTGDQVLSKTAEILRGQVDVIANPILSHFSGSEFAILINGISESDSDQFAKHISQALKELNALGIDESQSEAYIGVACYKTKQSRSELYANADMALTRAQSTGEGGWYRYTSGSTDGAASLGAQNWRRFLRQAIENERLEVHFQEVVLSNEALSHYEVLARIPGPDGHLIAAGVFIPMVEREGLSAQLDRMTVNAWLAFMKKHNDSSSRFAINLSSHSIQDADFIDSFLRVLQQHPNYAARLIVELPEYGVYCQLENVRILIKKIASLNCQFAIDHFGRGFSSFGYLRTMKVDYLKIDGSLIRGIGEDVENQFYVESLIKSAHEIEIPVFAEYVESKQDMVTLMSLGIDGFQGFLFGKPRKDI